MEFDHHGIVGYGCIHGCADVELGRACTRSPGVTPTDGHIDLCPPEAGCIDAIMHRTGDRDWHTIRGTTADAWQQRATAVAS